MYRNTIPLQTLCIKCGELTVRRRSAQSDTSLFPLATTLVVAKPSCDEENSKKMDKVTSCFFTALRQLLQQLSSSTLPYTTNFYCQLIMMSTHAAALVALLVTTVMASPNFMATRTTAVNLFNPPAIPQVITAPPPLPKRLTNAQRLARGLPPNPPVRRKNSKRNGQVRRENPSPLPAVVGYIRCTCDKTVVGVPAGGAVWFGQNANSWGEYGATASQNDALVVNVPGGSSSAVDLTTMNGNLKTSFPNIVAVMGFASTNNNLGPGSYHYTYFSASTSTPPSSPAVVQPNAFSSASGMPKGVESAIWKINWSK
ncbi:hypothetical protein HGRIS_003188 [Hohenbuehelia grisea]|uniref:Uncharacterized protein n=1 Tax=Hohenbuehelia grisea TaxID=104357 RepID=A0ABR3JMP6_9AGAR